MYGFAAGLFLFCFAVVGLKDIEDHAGDCAVGLRNLFARYGEKLLTFSLAGLLADVFFVVFLPIRMEYKCWLWVLIAASAACIAWHRGRPGQLAALYVRVIRMVQVWGVILFARLFLL